VCVCVYDSFLCPGVLRRQRICDGLIAHPRRPTRCPKVLYSFRINSKLQQAINLVLRELQIVSLCQDFEGEFMNNVRHQDNQGRSVQF